MGDSDLLYRTYAERIAKLTPLNSHGQRVIGFGRMKKLLGLRCHIPVRLQAEFVRGLEVRGFIIVNHHKEIMFVDGLGDV